MHTEDFHTSKTIYIYARYSKSKALEPSLMSQVYFWKTVHEEEKFTNLAGMVWERQYVLYVFLGTKLRGSTLGKSVKKSLFFLLKKGLYLLFRHVPKHYGASSTVNTPKNVSKEGYTRTFITFSDNLFFLLKMWHFHL